MKIWLVDKQKYFTVTYMEARNILAFGLQPWEWTRDNIQKIILELKGEIS